MTLLSEIPFLPAVQEGFEVEPVVPMISSSMGVLTVLLAVLGVLFAINRHTQLKRIFTFLPLLVFCYFVPTLLSNTDVIPRDGSFELYGFVKTYLLPASLVLLTLSVDIKAIFGLGKNAVLLFLGATAAIVIGGPLAYLLVVGGGNLLGFELVSPELGDQAWRGLAALSGSWIGGGANFIAIGESVQASESIIGLMVVVDVAIANIWMAVLLLFAGREKQMDDAIGADRASLDQVRQGVADYQAEVARPTDLASLLTMLAIAFGASTLANYVVSAGWLPDVGEIIRGFTWVVILVTAVGLALSFTPLRRLEGAGASAVGSVMLYLLVTTIGAKAEFSAILKPENTGMLLVGGVWMLFHVMILLWIRKRLRAPIFFLAVGSKANIGGAASAPIVASAFHPALAPVGVLLAIGGYVLGTAAALLCAQLLSMAHGLMFG
jgi:uncharacterized membrane protein